MNRGPIVGIDLGTTFSSLTYLDDDLRPQPLANAEGELTTASIVFIRTDGDGVEVGQRALKLGFEHPERFIANAKRYLGDPDISWEVDGVEYSPVDVLAFIVRKLLRDAEPRLGKILRAVITVPAHYTGLQRALTIEAGKQAGLERVDIINEPVAAALSFTLGKAGLAMTYLHEDSTILVYDLGGGTFDLSLVRYDTQQLRVLATSGEKQLGGIDWDQCLVDFVADHFKRIYGSDIRSSKPALRRLAYEIERAKRRLSEAQIERTTVPVVFRGKDAEFELDRNDFEQLTRPLVERTAELTLGLLDAARMDWQSVDYLIPVGGATHMPMIARRIEGFARGPQGPQIRKISPELSIAQGAALFAGIIHSEGDVDKLGAGMMAHVLSRYRTANVSASSLGIVVRGRDGQYVNHKLIERNAPLPSSANVVVSTVKPNQRRVKIRVMEGDAKPDQDDKTICNCVLDSLPENLPANSKFDVNLMYDADGLLQVIAEHRASGRLATVSILRT